MGKSEIYNIAEKYAKPYRRSFIVLLAAMVMKLLIDMSFGLMYGLIVDEIIYYRNLEAFFNLAVITMILVFSYVFSCLMETGAFWNTQLRFVLDFRISIMKSVYNARAQFLDHLNSGDVIRTVNLDSPEYMNVITDNVFETISTVIVLSIIAVISFAVNKYLAFAMLVQVPFSTILAIKAGSVRKENAHSLRKQQGDVDSWILEIIKGSRDIHLLNGQKYTMGLFSDYYGRVVHSLNKTMYIDTAVLCLGKIIVLISDLCFYLVGAYQVFNGQISVGAFISMVSLALFAQKQLTKLCEFYILLKSRQVSLTNVLKYIRLEPENGPDKNKLICSSGEIVFSELEFGYQDGKKVFDNFNLRISPGEKVAIVGKSGSGKSTLVKLLVKMYEPDSGKIFIDGQNIFDCSNRSVRKQIGYVQQDVFLFEGTLRYNLTFGDRSYRDEDIMEACRAACVEDLVRSLPEGLDTVLGTNGMRLSGGQKQRIAIARVILRKPSILIFDEAVSSLDSETEGLINLIWKENSKEKTSVIVTHRLTSAMMADKVLVLKEGKIEAYGAPEDLYKRNEAFRSLFQV